MRIRGWHISFIRWGIKFERKLVWSKEYGGTTTDRRHEWVNVGVLKHDRLAVWDRLFYTREEVEAWRANLASRSEPEVSAANSERRM